MTNQEVISLKDYIDTLLSRQHDYFSTKIDSVDKATCLAAATLERRLEGMNEFRLALDDQSRTMITRVEWVAFKESTDKDIKFLRESRAELAGMASQKSVNFAMLCSIAALVLGAMAVMVALVR